MTKVDVRFGDQVDTSSLRNLIVVAEAEPGDDRVTVIDEDGFEFLLPIQRILYVNAGDPLLDLIQQGADHG